MASILLSFVGSQDPYSGNNNQEGSIVTLTRHLISQNIEISKLLLLYTNDLTAQAELTQEWLHSELKILLENIEIIKVSEELSNDPINVALTLPDARKCLQKATECKRSNDDLIEFNSSSGTPAMKTTWAVLQASGIAPKSRIWQVRNPFQMKEGQERVFENNVNVVKNESDLKVIKKQLQNYNYNGALDTFDNSNLKGQLAKFLMEYGHYRLAFDFTKAFYAINNYQEQIDSSLFSQITALKNKKFVNILAETYYKSELKLKNKQYTDFLILAFAFHENLLRYLVKQILFSEQEIDQDFAKLEDEGKVKNKIEKLDSGKLLEYLKNYQIPRLGKLRLDWTTPHLSRLVLQAIVDYRSINYTQLISLLKELDQSVNIRNDIVHNLRGLSELNDAQNILNLMKKILQQITSFSNKNPFDLLNQEILNHLTNY
jgi:hypothetical protein